MNAEQLTNVFFNNPGFVYQVGKEYYDLVKLNILINGTLKEIEALEGEYNHNQFSQYVHLDDIYVWTSRKVNKPELALVHTIPLGEQP